MANSLAQLAVNATFASTLHGKNAIYQPLVGAPIACRVILDRKDADLGFGRGQPIIEGRLLEVRASEVGDLKSAKGASFALTETAETLTIVEDPRCEDPDRLVWTMTVR